MPGTALQWAMAEMSRGDEVAQLVEREAPDQEVMGLIPSPAEINIMVSPLYLCVAARKIVICQFWDPFVR